MTVSMAETKQPQQPEPNSAHRRLAVFIGKWRAEGSSYAEGQRADDPLASAVPWASEESYEWLPGGFFVLHRWDAMAGRQVFKGLEIIGHDEREGGYFTRFFDNAGNHPEYRAEVDGNVWTFSEPTTRATVTVFDAGNRNRFNWHGGAAEATGSRCAIASRGGSGSPGSSTNAMTLSLYFHPLASFCQKVLVALYENDTPFVPHMVDRMELKRMWPVGKMPVLRDDSKDRTVPESSIIIEYLSLHYPGMTQLVPVDADLASQSRLRDRFYDLYVHEPMQKIVTDRLRPPGKNDPHGEELAGAQLRTAYGMIDEEMRTNTWAMGDVFSMADCAAAPSLFYANQVLPFGGVHNNLADHFDRLMDRPSFAHAAQPYFSLFPGEIASQR
jgi:glutathione S-transferase